MKSLFSLLFIGLLAWNATWAQAQAPAPCGTPEGISPWLRNFQQRVASAPRSTDVLYVPMQIHVVGTDEGAGYMARDIVLRSFCNLNRNYEQANIQFYLAGDINYIDNSRYYQHEYDGGYELIERNNVPNVANCYIVEGAAGNCGYFFPGVDGVVLAKSCTQPQDKTWAHEMGHFLSLPHPFYGWEWADDNHDYNTPAPNDWDGQPVERVNGANCQAAGDGFCDTPPDYLNYRWSCTNDGVSSVVQTDPNGETFVSDGSLYMSYSNDACANRFSPDQIAAMRANLFEERPNLIVNSPDPSQVTIDENTTLQVVSPAPETVFTEGPVRLQWEPVPNATHYIVQVNPFSIFSIVFNEFVVETPYIDFDNLLPNRTFYWRVRPYSDFATCTSYIGVSSFKTGALVTATQTLYADESVRVYPNPVTAAGGATIDISSPTATYVHWLLKDVHGRTLQQQQAPLALQGLMTVPTQGLPAGLYFLHIALDDRQVIRKLTVQ